MENIIFIKKDDYNMTASAFEDDKFQIKNIALQTRDRLSALECKKKTVESILCQYFQNYLQKYNRQFQETDTTWFCQQTIRLSHWTAGLTCPQYRQLNEEQKQNQ